MSEKIDTLIIGGGQAGLSLSYWLTQQQREHLVLEKSSRPGNVWLNQRWDSFTFVTPNWMIRLPGAEYKGNDPDGYLKRDEIVEYFDQYPKRFGLPMRYNTNVLSVEQQDGGYQVRTDAATFAAANVVIATGLFQKAKIPSLGKSLLPHIKQMSTSEYRNPGQLPAGGVLVVGSAQSGCQIAEELYQSGRKVYLCVGSAGRIPRRYRGKDIVWWLEKIGFFDRTPDKLPSPKAKFAGNPQASGKNGGHTINLHQFARDGVTLLGRLVSAQGGKITLAPDLKENLAKVDKFEADAIKMIDDYIARADLDAPTETLPTMQDGYETPLITELDLQSAGITSIIWAVGFAFDFSLVKLPVVDGDGYPLQTRGVTEFPGLYFLGMPWLHKVKSGLLVGVGEDAAFVASHISNRKIA